VSTSTRALAAGPAASARHAGTSSATAGSKAAIQASLTMTSHLGVAPD
jgi:hypothetical protein